MGGDRDLQLGKLRPDGIVVMGTVEAEPIDIDTALRRVRLPIRVCLYGAKNAAPGHHLP